MIMQVYIGETYGDKKTDALKRFRELYGEYVIGQKLTLERTGSTWSPGPRNGGYNKYDVYCELTRANGNKFLKPIEHKLPFIVR
jgi:hypothetical protein